MVSWGKKCCPPELLPGLQQPLRGFAAPFGPQGVPGSFFPSQIWLGISYYLLCRGKHLPLLASETSMKKKEKLSMGSSDFRGRLDVRFESFEQGGGGGAALVPVLSHRAWEPWSESKTRRCQIPN